MSTRKPACAKCASGVAASRDSKSIMTSRLGLTLTFLRLAERV
jgi:hypothetical protein